MAELFTAYRPEILIAIGLYYFPWLEQDQEEARERGKALCHRLDYDGTDYGFNVTHGLPTSGAGYKDPARLNIQLENGETFNLQTFIDEKKAQTKWLADNLPHMLELIRATGDKDKPEATLRSFVNQDYESVHTAMLRSTGRFDMGNTYSLTSMTG